MTEITFQIPAMVKEGTMFPPLLQNKKGSIKVVGHTSTVVEVVMNPTMSYLDHVKLVTDFLEGKSVTPSRDIHVEIPLDAEDLDLMEPEGVLVWDTVFRKPAPVRDLVDWSESQLADQYVYLPNSIRKQGVEAEEYMTNAYYTEVLTNAYRTMCETLQIKPVAMLSDGVNLISCHAVQPHHGSQMSLEGERSTRLANSKLIDFDDSPYAKEFIKHIMKLKPYQYENESIRRTVLAKVEYALMGRTSHTYNQKFMKRFMQKFDHLDYANSERVLHVLSAMVSDGLVLEDSYEDFEKRLIRSRLDSDMSTLLQIFKECHHE